MRIKSNKAAWLLPLLPFTFVSLIFSSGCKEPTNDSPSYVPLTGVWEGTFGIDISVVLDLVEVRSDSIIGDIVISTAIWVGTLNIVTGIRTENDSLLFQAHTRPGEDLASFYMHGSVEDSLIKGKGQIYPPETHREETLLAKRVQ